MSRIIHPSGITRAGASAFADPNTAYIRTSGGAGGVVGNPNRPFGTWQQAFNSGSRVFDFGVGTAVDFGGLITGGSATFTIRGKGLGKTALGTLTLPGGATVIITDAGCHSCSIASVIGNGLAGDDGANADDPGQPGQAGGNISFRNVFCLGTVSLLGGDGGNANTGGMAAEGGSGGNGGSISFFNSQAGNCSLDGGDGGEDYDGAGDGSDGTGGSISLVEGTIIGNLSSQGGNGPLGNGIGGSLVISYSTVGDLNLAGPAVIGEISGTFATFTSITAGSPISLFAYVSSGAFNP